MDPISGVLLFFGGTSILYNVYNYMWGSTPVKETEIIPNKTDLQIKKETIINKIDNMKQDYDITYDDVIIELKHLFEYRNNLSSDEDICSDSEEALFYIDDDMTIEEFIMN